MRDPTLAQTGALTAPNSQKQGVPHSPQMPFVGIFILDRNSRQDTVECLQSVWTFDLNHKQEGSSSDHVQTAASQHWHACL